MGLIEANELAMIDWACCRLRLGIVWDLMMEWLPSLCCLLKERAGYLAERVNKAERVQTLLQSTLLGSSRRIASAQLLSLRSETINGFLSN